MQAAAHVLPPVCCSELTWSQSGHLAFVSLTRTHEPPTQPPDLQLNAKAEPFPSAVTQNRPMKVT